MAENIPPNSASAATTSTADQPGRPYYESLRTTLRQTLEKKRRLDEQLAALEDQIYKTEGNYLEDTAGSGNIVRGFDGWVKGVAIGARNAADDRRRGRVREEDRVFSRSSVSWLRVRYICCLCQNEDLELIFPNNRHRKVEIPTRHLMLLRPRVQDRRSSRGEKPMHPLPQQPRPNRPTRRSVCLTKMTTMTRPSNEVKSRTRVILDAGICHMVCVQSEALVTNR